MNRLIPGLVICSAIIAIGSGAVVFSKSSGRGSGMWDVMFLTSALAFLVLFLIVLRHKAAATISGTPDDPGDPDAPH